MSMDAYRFLTALDSRDSGARLRIGQATVRSVEGDATYGTASGRAWIVPAIGEWPTGVLPANYLGEYPPRPGGAAWYVTDGVDRIVLGMVAPEGPPIGVVSLAAATSIANDTLTTVTASSAISDPWNMSNGTGLRIPVSGAYQLHVDAAWAADGGGYRTVAVLLNGTELARAQGPSNATVTHNQQVAFRPRNLSQGDAITVQVRQTSGGALNLNALTLSATYVGRRRTSGTGPELLAYGEFDTGALDDGIGWSTVGAESATWSIVGGADAYSGDYAAKGVHAAGTVSTSLNSVEVLPVVPRQLVRVSARVKTSAALAGTGTNGVQLWMACAGDGFPGDDVVSYVVGSVQATTTGYTLVSSDLRIPDDCYVARVVLVTYTTSGVTVFWDSVSAVEVIR